MALPELNLTQKHRRSDNTSKSSGAQPLKPKHILETQTTRKISKTTEQEDGRMRGTSHSGRQVRSNKPVAYLNDDRECVERVDSRKTEPATRHGFHYISKYQGLSEIYSVFCLRVKKIPNFYDVGPQDRAFLLFKEVAVLRNATAWATSYHLQMKSKIVTAISALKRKTVDNPNK